MKRIFLIVLDSVGIGEMPDAEFYGDRGSNTIKSCSKQKGFKMSYMRELGLFNIDGVDCVEGVLNPRGSYARMSEISKGKDTTTGHWEIAGLKSDNFMPTFPKGFPEEIINKFSSLTGRKVLCNKPYSGTEVIKDYGRESIETGALIVYTSADSVFQIAAHESVVPIEELYDYCRAAREILQGEYAVGRVIARPFTGEYPEFKRTSNRHDFSLEPHGLTALDYLKEAGLEVIAVGKINDIFAGRGITRALNTVNNADGMDKTINIASEKFEGLCFVNLVDFDMLYGHRNDAEGYARALSEFDIKLRELSSCLKSDDIVIITADHGCDPTTASTDHSREYTPMIIFGSKIKQGVNLGTRRTFGDIGATVLEYLGVDKEVYGQSFLKEVLNNEN